MKSRRHRSPRPDTMKCVKLSPDGLVERAPNETAALAVSTGKARYVPKSEWKKQRELR